MNNVFSSNVITQHNRATHIKSKYKPLQFQNVKVLNIVFRAAIHTVKLKPIGCPSLSSLGGLTAVPLCPRSPGRLPLRAGLCQRDPSPWTGGEGPPEPHQLPSPAAPGQAWTADILHGLDGRQAFWFHSVIKSTPCYVDVIMKSTVRSTWEWLLWSSGWCVVFCGRADWDAWVMALVWAMSVIFTSIGQLFGPWATVHMLCFCEVLCVDGIVETCFIGG